MGISEIFRLLQEHFWHSLICRSMQVSRATFTVSIKISGQRGVMVYSLTWHLQ